MKRSKEGTDRAKSLLRYQVVSQVRALLLGGTKRSAAISAVAGRLFYEDNGQARHFSRRTVQRWLRAYEKSGLDGLQDKPRSRCESSLVLAPELLAYLKEQKDKDRPASIPELLRRAREAGKVHPQERIDRTTVWRALQRMGVSTRRVRQVEVDDKRRFAYPERMQMVLVDYKHFRAGPHRARRVAIYFLDDATRMGLGVLVGTDGEKALYTLLCLFEVLQSYGLMLVIYFDRGPGFFSDDVHSVLARLGVPYVHGKARYPEAHGKIEVFNRGAKARLLRNLAGAAWVDPDPAALTLRLRHDLFEVYNHLPHESLGHDTPWQRWQGSTRPLRPAAEDRVLKELFVVEEERTVTNDHCISLNSVAYEVPLGLAGRRITVERAVLEDDSIYLRHQDKRIRLHPVDPVLNARSGRARGRKTKEDEAKPSGSPVKNASSLSFEHEYGSILQPDGGFPETKDADCFTTHHMEEEDGE